MTNHLRTPMRHRLLVAAIFTQLVALHAVTAQDTTAARRDSLTRARQLSAVRVTATSTATGRYTSARTRTATRTDTPLLDVPQSVSVVGRALIADQGMQSMGDVVRYVPGVQMGQGEGHRDAPTIRGQSSTADFYVDGVRDDAQYLRDLYNVERIEALKGANAMTFGRGGGGGVLNRVTKEAGWRRTASLTAEGGSYDHKRSLLDVGGPVSDRLALRLNAMAEDSRTFRQAFRLKRHALNPVATMALGAASTLRVGYESAADDRTVDRGIPSFQGLPAPGDVRVFFGDPDASRSRSRVDGAHATLERPAGSRFTVRNHARWTGYDKFYQNVYAGSAVNSAGTQVSLAAYNNTTRRANLFDQLDVTGSVGTGLVRHTLLAGAEVGRQRTDNDRNTGYFDNTGTSIPVSVAQPTVAPAVTFRRSPTDADNHVVAVTAAAYAQDQLAIGDHVELVAGVRIDRFAMRFYDNRPVVAVCELERVDRSVSPRLGIVLKPAPALSLYASRTVSYLPASGDQFSQLTATTAALEPELFTNAEAGVKWEPVRRLMISAAAYRLDRTNSTAPDPSDATRLVQTGAQRTTGVELGAVGSLADGWEIAAAFAAQRARIVSATTAARAGATTPLVPGRTESLWNRVRLHRALSAGLGVSYQGRAFAAIDNSVTLPAFTRADAALFVHLLRHVDAQLNVENVGNVRYYWTSQGNNNILPGAPRHLRLSLTAGL